jgi:hypothetical protein
MLSEITVICILSQDCIVNENINIQILMYEIR